MAKRVVVEATYPADADRLFRGALSFREMKDAMKGVATYNGLPDDEAEEGATYRVRTKIWGWLDVGEHEMFVEEINFAKRFVQSRERNPAVRRWDHALTVARGEDGAVWRDEIVIDAGWRTVGAAEFARRVYLSRHRRRKAMQIQSRIVEVVA
ncbi:MAG: hypothetical protein GC152_08265 [Alphaproteobacteria bacterium]|nr:hypothetical protein [Alphaproteobacteria bacterium]